MGEHGHSVKPYIKVYFILLGLFAVSVAGPMVADFLPHSESGGRTNVQLILILVTAFGIAFVKAYLVASRFMHLNVERPIVWYILTTCCVFMVLLFAAVSPDVQNHSGSRWVNQASKDFVQKNLESGGGHHGAAHGEHDEPAGHDAHDEPAGHDAKDDHAEEKAH